METVIGTMIITALACSFIGFIIILITACSMESKAKVMYAFFCEKFKSEGVEFDMSFERCYNGEEKSKNN